MSEFKMITGGNERRMKIEIGKLRQELSTMQASFANKVLDNESLEDEHGKDVRKIENLRAELAAAKADDWTPIESVEQVEGLAAGFYDLKGDGGVNNPVAVKTTGAGYNWRVFYRDGSFSTDDDEAISEFTSYKLIRAFSEPAAPAIPQKKYFFKAGWDNPACDMTLQEIADNEEIVPPTREMAADFIEARKRIAALEALAKETK